MEGGITEEFEFRLFELAVKDKQLISCRLTNDETNHDKGTVISRDTDSMEIEGKKLNKLGKYRSRIGNKLELSGDFGGDVDFDQHGLATPSSREEKVSTLKTVSSLFVSFFRLLDFIYPSLGLAHE